MSQELKATIRESVEAVWNEGRLDLLDQLYSADVVRHSPPFPSIEGLSAHEASITAIRDAFPDIHLTVHEVVVDGDTVVTRWTWQGTHTGESPTFGIPPTGKPVTMTGSTLCHNGDDGRTVEEWMYADWLGELQQLGVVPPMGTRRE